MTISNIDGPAPSPRLYDIPGTAAELNISTKEVRRLIQRGVLRSVSIGRRRLVPAAALDEFCAGLEAV